MRYCIYIFNKIIKTYSINDIQLFENNESGKNTYMTNSMIIYDLNIQKILIYGTNNGFLEIRKLSDMTLINTNDFLAIN